MVVSMPWQKTPEPQWERHDVANVGQEKKEEVHAAVEDRSRLR